MKKKIIALVSAVALLLSAMTLPAFAESAETPADIVPDWFDADQTDKWWATTKTSETWHHTIAAADGVWKYTAVRESNWNDEGKAYSFGTAYKIDLDETPNLKFAVTTTVPFPGGTDIMLRFNEKDYVTVAFVQGDSSVSVDLSANDDIIKFADENNIIEVNGFAFSTNEYYNNRSISFSNVAFSAARGENIKRYEWFDESCDTKWGQDDWQYSADNDNNRFLVLHPSGIKWQLKHRWSGTKRADVNTDARLLNINDFSKLCYDIQWTSQKTDISLRVIPFVNGTNDGQKITNITVGTVAKGAQKGSFDLKANSELMAAANDNGELQVIGMSFSLDGFNYNDMINIIDLYFKAEPVTVEAEFTAEGTEIAKADAGAKVTVSASAQTAGTEDVTYKWYVDGVLQEGADSALFELPNDKVGMHTIRGVVKAGSGYYKSAGKLSQTYTYGAYLSGNVSMSGELGAGDLASLRKYLLGAAEYNELQSLAADANGDSKIDIRDLINLKKLLAE